MIADIFQEIYKGSAANKRGTREQLSRFAAPSRLKKMRS